MHISNEAKVLAGIVVVTVLIVIGAVFFLSRSEKPITVDPSKLEKADSLKISSDSAKLTIVEFGDYQCPACALAHPGIKRAVADFSGQVNFVFRHFPLAQHKNAMLAAKAVESANLQGKVWEMHDKLYESQPEWETDANALEIFKKYAVEFGMDVEKFATDINNPPFQEKITGDISDGNSLGVNSTPTFFFNNELYKGGVSYENFKSEIEKYLKK